MGERIDQSLETFIYYLESGKFRTWEAVMAAEQGLPLSKRQRRELAGLLDFSDGSDERILYIDEMPRPSEPWYAILNRIVQKLLLPRYRTTESYLETYYEGWRGLQDALEEYGEGLSLPPGARRPLDAVPEALRDQLWLQECLIDAFGGVGLADQTLESEPERMADFIERLREHPERAAALQLTIAALLQRLSLPEQEEPVFVKMLQEQLGLASTTAPLAPDLSAPAPVG